MIRALLFAGGLALAVAAFYPTPVSADTTPPVYQAEILARVTTFDARQAIAVDATAFYAVNNFRITKHDKRSGEPLLQWDGGSDSTGPLIHLDSAVVHEGRLYAAHSNYPGWPMSSSVEIWDTLTMAHVGTHSFGILLGSMTWLDWHEGHWWAAFGNYDRVPFGGHRPYGETMFTQIVKMDARFQILAQWTLPAAVLERLSPMSNSGGSWGPDGYLYLSGHDRPEIYVMQIPAAGSTLDWVATVEVPQFEGQGIAWDRSVAQPDLWGIQRRGTQAVTVRMPEIALPPPVVPGVIRTPGRFAQ